MVQVCSGKSVAGRREKLSENQKLAEILAQHRFVKEGPRGYARESKRRRRSTAKTATGEESNCTKGDEQATLLFSPLMETDDESDSSSAYYSIHTVYYALRNVLSALSTFSVLSLTASRSSACFCFRTSSERCAESPAGMARSWSKSE